MPFVDVTLVEGRSPQELRGLITALTDAVVASLGTSPDSVRVVLRELPATHWAAAGETIAERRAARPPG
jgi:4-oxalocrotonate tautomerase